MIIATVYHFLGGLIRSFILISWSSWMDAFTFSGVVAIKRWLLIENCFHLCSSVRPYFSSFYCKTKKQAYTMKLCYLFASTTHLPRDLLFNIWFFMLQIAPHSQNQLEFKLPHWNHILKWTRKINECKICTSFSTLTSRLSCTKVFWFFSVNFINLASGPPLNIRLLE